MSDATVYLICIGVAIVSFQFGWFIGWNTGFNSGRETLDETLRSLGVDIKEGPKP